MQQQQQPIISVEQEKEYVKEHEEEYKRDRLYADFIETVIGKDQATRKIISLFTIILSK